MHNSRFFCVTLLTIIFSIGLIFHSAEAEGMSLSSNNAIYYTEDYIVIFGEVDTVFEDVPVTIQIYHESALIDVAQVQVAKDGTFASTFNAVGHQWRDEGTYSARAFYTPTIIAEISFEYYSQIIDKSSAQFPVNIPNSGTFDVGYTIRGGEVENISMNQSGHEDERYSLLVKTTMDSSGNLILKLPRESFDAQHDGNDITFIIMISKEDSVNNVDMHHTVTRLNFDQVEYEEIATSSDYRTIRIPLEEGDQWIEVIGTYVIPEFGSIAIIILVVAVSSAIIISKSRFAVRYN